ncbi:MAG TPA: nuclease-related domain-containing protein [Gammaproteobacteria bacterium]|nr:nuclease-related domain-containing protein [Gammaproteobacteria bacterium]
MAHAWYDNWQVWTLAGAALAVLLAIVALAVWLRLTAVRRDVNRTLRVVSDRLIRDVVIPDGIGGFVPVDALILRERRLYVLDVRDVEGAVFGSEKMDIWTAMGKRRRYQFNNPIRPMHDRVAAVKYLVPGIEVLPRILFTSRGHFPKGRPDGVQLLEEFAQPLLRAPTKEPMALDAELQAVWDKVCEAANVPPGKERPLPVRRG